MPADSKTKTTVVKLRKQKADGEKTVLVTAYNNWQARLVEEAGVDCILVGDSCGMVEHGYPTTIPVTMDEMINHCEAVKRCSDNAFLIGDMPYMSYQISDELAVENAGRFIQAGCDCVKVEGGMIPRIKAISDAGILVMSHLGLTPQTRAKLGGYRVQGKTADDAQKILDSAKRMEDAGCDFLLLEAMPVEPAEQIAMALDIPVYGIGAGDKVDGQLVIFHDLMGLFWEFKSKFVKRYCEAGKLMLEGMKSYVAEVRGEQFPSEEQFYVIKESELHALLSAAKWKYEKVIEDE